MESGRQSRPCCQRGRSGAHGAGLNPSILDIFVPASDTPAISPPLFITKPTTGCCAVLVSMRPFAPISTTATVASANGPTAAVTELVQRALRHEQHHGLGLRAGLEADRAGGGAVVAGIGAAHAQHALAVLGADDEAAAQHVREYQHALGARHQLRTAATPGELAQVSSAALLSDLRCSAGVADEVGVVVVQPEKSRPATLMVAAASRRGGTWEENRTWNAPCCCHPPPL